MYAKFFNVCKEPRLTVFLFFKIVFKSVIIFHTLKKEQVTLKIEYVTFKPPTTLLDLI